MNLDLDAIQRAAEDATPGQWYGDARQGFMFVYRVRQSSGGMIGSEMTMPAPLAVDVVAQDVAFMLASQPSVVRELVRRLRAAEAVTKSAIEWYSANGGDECHGKEGLPPVPKFVTLALAINGPDHG